MKRSPKGSGIYKKCLYCNIEFYIPIWRKNTTKFCSRKCKDSMPPERIKSICVICNNEFEHKLCRANKAKYCSRKCYHKGQVNKGTIKTNCPICKKEYLMSPSRIGIRKSCSRTCYAILKKQETNVPISSNNFRKFWLRRGMILKCERCGYQECENILGIHHKDRNRENNTKENLEVLCPNCHSLEHQRHVVHGNKERKKP